MTIQCKGELIDLDSPKIMGILNVTPDSFYDGGKHNTITGILTHAEKLLSNGATFIDLGAYSSRPGATHISEKEELNRLIPAIDAILKRFPETLISVDTFRSKVAKTSVEAGAAIINDISGGELDIDMLEVVASLRVPYILMHMKGTPDTMQQQAVYNNIIKEVNFYFSEKMAKARSYGINDIIIDPGFGFAKTTQQNYELMNNLEILHFLEAPILVGISRKSMIYKLLNLSPDESLNGTTILNTIALQKGAHIIRVHDVKEAMECVTILQQFKN